MRRALIRGLIRGLAGLVLFAVGAAVGVDLAGDALPRSLRSAVESALSEALGTPVEIESARLLILPGLTVEASGLRAWPGADGPAFTAGRLEAALELPTLASGRLRFSSIALDEVSLALERSADDHWTPPLLSPGVRNPLVVLEELFSAELPARTIDVRSGRLSITDLGIPRAAGGPGRFTLGDLQLRLLAARVLSRGRLTLRGRLATEPGRSTPIELQVAAQRGQLPRLELAAAGLPFEPFLPYLRRLEPGLAVAGRASGVATLAPAPGNETALGLDVVLSGLRTGPDILGWPHPPLATDRMTAELSLRIGKDALVLDEGQLDAEELALRLGGSLERPLGDESLLSLETRFEELGVARLKRLADFLPEQARGGFERVLLDLRSGRFEALTLSGEAPLARWLRRDPAHDPWLPEGAVFSARVDDLTFGPPGAAPVSTIRGEVRLRSPDTLLVSDLEGTLDGQPLPHLDLQLDGLAHLLAVEPEPVPPVPALAGREPLSRLLLGDPKPDDAPADWRSLEIEADRLDHPMFFRPLRSLKVRLEPTSDGVRLALAHASWGGIPIHGEGSWVVRAPERARLWLAAGPPEPHPVVETGAQSWAHGRFSLERQPGAGFRVEQLDGGFDLAGERLTVFDASARLGVPGRLAGDARLDLTDADRVPAQLRFSLTDARVPDLLAALSDDPAASSGSLDIQARLAGDLVPGRRLLTTMDGDGTITAVDGRLGVDLPVLLAIAKASTTFNPFASAEGVRFDRISAELQVKSGIISTKRTLTIESPDLRLAISGSVDVNATPSQLEAVVGCFFFKPLDQVLGAMPVLSRILLGPDRSLFGTYFELTGPFESPSAGMIPTRTLALGPATFLMQDVPSFVKQGVEAIQGILPSLGGEAPAVASPAESADPMGDGS